ADAPVYERPRSKLKAKAGSDETAAEIRPVFTGGEADPLASSPRSSGFNPPRPAFDRSPVRVDGGEQNRDQSCHRLPSSVTIELPSCHDFDVIFHSNGV
ncbi:MAG TPA: hypothetical protein PKE64_31265, partial [Anaerolineae bacterium]|nr:hypothetical protein [Anaerolineae bacterium]